MNHKTVNPLNNPEYLKEKLSSLIHDVEGFVYINLSNEIPFRECLLQSKVEPVDEDRPNKSDGCSMM